MASLPYTNSAPTTLSRDLNHDASLGATPGDMMYLDESENNVKPAGQFTDYGTAADTQRAFAVLFAGLSTTRQLSTDSTGRVAGLITDTVITFPCASTTYEVGDYFAPTYSAGVLSNQELTKVTDPSRAVARAVARSASAATTVKVRMTAPVFGGMAFDRRQYGSLGSLHTGWRAQTIDMADAAVTLTRIPGTPTGTLLTGNWLLVDANSSTSENLLLPPEADMADVLLILKNTGGETINLQNDAGGAVATVATGEIAIAFCDGTTWTVIQAIETT